MYQLSYLAASQHHHQQQQQQMHQQQQQQQMQQQQVFYQLAQPAQTSSSFIGLGSMAFPQQQQQQQQHLGSQIVAQAPLINYIFPAGQPFAPSMTAPPQLYTPVDPHIPVMSKPEIIPEGSVAQLPATSFPRFSMAPQAVSIQALPSVAPLVTAGSGSLIRPVARFAPAGLHLNPNNASNPNNTSNPNPNNASNENDPLSIQTADPVSLSASPPTVAQGTPPLVDGAFMPFASVGVLQQQPQQQQRQPLVSSLLPTASSIVEAKALPPPENATAIPIPNSNTDSDKSNTPLATREAKAQPDTEDDRVRWEAIDDADPDDKPLDPDHPDHRPGIFRCSHRGCSGVLSSIYCLKRHMKLHESNDVDRNSHTCRICDRKFTERSSLKRHMRLHTGERPFVCLVGTCGKSFIDSGNLRTHERVHEKKPFQCKFCLRLFPNHDMMAGHIAKKHRHRPRSKRYLIDIGQVVAEPQAISAPPVVG